MDVLRFGYFFHPSEQIPYALRLLDLGLFREQFPAAAGDKELFLVLRGQMFYGVGIDPSFLLLEFPRIGIRFNYDGQLFPDIDAFLEVVWVVALQLVQSLHGFFRPFKSHQFTKNDILAAIKDNEAGEADWQVVEQPLAVGRLDAGYLPADKAVEILVAFHQTAIDKKIGRREDVCFS